MALLREKRIYVTPWLPLLWEREEGPGRTLEEVLARLVQNHPPLAVQEGHAVTEGDDSLELLRDLQERGLDLFLLEGAGPGGGAVPH